MATADFACVHSSQAFYAARGYHEAGRYPDTEWNSDLTTILLVKVLARG